MLRRGSTAVNVDDRGIPYPAVALNAQSSFSSPEGDYLLAYEVSPPVPVTPATPGGNPTTPAAAAAAAAALASSTNEFPASLSVAVITFPAASSSGGGSGLLGLGNSQRAARSRDASTTQMQDLYQSNTPGPSNLSNSVLSGNGQPLDDQASSSHSGSSYDNNGQQGSNTNATGHSPASSRRRPLMSLPSMSSMPLPSLGNNNNSGAAPGPSTSKPKSAFRGTSSNFVKSYEGLPFSGRADKIWQGQEAREVTFAIFTTPKATFISDISPRAKFRDPVARLAFAATPTCTAINYSTLSHERMDLLIGFHTGDIIWVEVFSGRYTRYNKDPIAPTSQTGTKQNAATYVSTSPVKKLQWLHGDQIFASAFQDGCIAFWDKDKEDPNGFVPTAGLAPEPGAVLQSTKPTLTRVDTGGDSMLQDYNSEEGHLGTHGGGSGFSFRTNGERQPRRHGSHMPLPPEEYTDDIVVTVAPPQVDKKSNSNRLNPIAHWKVSRKALTDFAMSPDDQYCAVTSEDGCLRIIECSSQRLLDTFQGYFGALTCVNWSPDGRFVLTGGQDDLACVWSPFEQRIVARCEGHSSFLTGLSFDPWRCDSRTQRFASVSEDCKLILWDLSSAALQRPKGHHLHGHQVVHHRRQSTAAMSTLSLSRRKTTESSGHLPSTGAVERENPLWHRAAPRGEVPGLQPVTVKPISNELLAGITFLSNMVVTISRGGTIKIFLRPDYRP